MAKYRCTYGGVLAVGVRDFVCTQDQVYDDEQPRVADAIRGYPWAFEKMGAPVGRPRKDKPKTV